MFKLDGDATIKISNLKGESIMITGELMSITPKTRGFEVVSKYAEDKDVIANKPKRATENAAAYDMAAAHDVIIQPLGAILSVLLEKIRNAKITEAAEVQLNAAVDADDQVTFAKIYTELMTLGLPEIKKFMKENKLQPTLISTGYKAYMQPTEVLKLFIRSSSPLNGFVVLANSTGVIDADYYNNPDNEGEIFFQVINLSPVPLHIKKGEILGQAMFQYFLLTDDDADQAKKVRAGGHGSTTVEKK